MDWTFVIVTALFSSICTLVVVAALFHFWLLPEIERHMDRKADEAAQRIEQQIRQRMAQGFADIVDPLRHVLKDRATDVARSTADIVGEGVRRMFDRLGPRPEDRG